MTLNERADTALAALTTQADTLIKKIETLVHADFSSIAVTDIEKTETALRNAGRSPLAVSVQIARIQPAIDARQKNLDAQADAALAALTSQYQAAAAQIKEVTMELEQCTLKSLPQLCQKKH